MLVKIILQLHFLLYVILYINSVLSVANNIHTYDGGAIFDFIGKDIFFEVLEPKELSYTFKIRPAKDFGAPFNSSFSAKGVRLVPVDPPCGCGKPRNDEDIEGAVALMERGECSFLSKAVRAEQAGAIAVVIADNDSSNDDYFIEMIDDGTGRDVSIPVAFLLGRNGFVIRDTLRKLGREYALINVPANLTNVPIHKLKQPPWVNW